MLPGRPPGGAAGFNKDSRLDPDVRLIPVPVVRPLVRTMGPPWALRLISVPGTLGSGSLYELWIRPLTVNVPPSAESVIIPPFPEVPAVTKPVGVSMELFTVRLPPAVAFKTPPLGP